MTLILSGTNGVSDVDGTAATPAIRGSDSNTGIFFPAADTIAFAEGGVESMRLDSSGNLGLGVTPSAWSGVKAIQVSSATFASTGIDSYLFANSFYNGSSDRYIGNGYASYYAQSAGKHLWYTAPSGTAGAAITFTQAMTLDASGNLLVGLTNGIGKLAVAPASGTGSASSWDNTFVTIAPGGTSTSTGLAFSVDTTNNRAQITSLTPGISWRDLKYKASQHIWEYGASQTEAARIDSSGRMLVGTTSQTAVDRLAVISATGTVDTALIENDNSSTFAANVLTLGATRATTNSTFNFLTCVTQNVAFRLHIRDSGNVVNQNNSYGAISDAKLKENVVDATPKLEKLNQVRVVNYNLIGETQKQIGVIAQELEQIFPGMIDESPDRDAEGNDLGTTTKAVKYSVFVPMLIKAIQELNAKVEAQAAEIAALKGQA